MSSGVIHPGQGESDDQPTLTGDEALATGVLDDLSFAGADDEWAVKGPAKGIRLALPAAALLAALLLGVGFWGGSAIQKSHTSSTSSGAAGSAGRFGAGGARPGGGFGGAGGAAGTGFGGGGTASSGTTGTISVVNGNTLYLLTSTGSLVKVTLGASTTITRDATTQTTQLRPGDTVVVQGASGKNGTVSATSVAATAAGVSSTSGGSAGGGGAAGTTTATATTTGG